MHQSSMFWQEGRPVGRQAVDKQMKGLLCKGVRLLPTPTCTPCLPSWRCSSKAKRVLASLVF